MPTKEDGVMIILSSPSGAGKTTLVNLLSKLDNFFTNVVLPAPEGDDKIIITPSFCEGIIKLVCFTFDELNCVSYS